MTDTRQDRVEGADGAVSPGLLATRLSFRVRMLNALLMARVMGAFQPFGLRAGAFTTMALIAANPGCSQADLAREGGIDKSGLVAIVDELEARGLAVRGRAPGDRRRHSLSLTPDGERVMQAMYAAGLDTEQPIRDALSPAQVDTLFELLEVAFAALRDAGPPAA